MPKLSPETVLKRCSDVKFRRVLDEAVVVRQQAAETLVLNEVAASVLEKCDGTADLLSILEQLAAEYEVARDTLEADLYRFADELIQSDLVEPVATP